MVGRIKENSPKISTLPENDVCEFESSSGHLDTHFSCAALWLREARPASCRDGAVLRSGI